MEFPLKRRHSTVIDARGEIVLFSTNTQSEKFVQWVVQTLNNAKRSEEEAVERGG